MDEFFDDLHLFPSRPTAYCVCIKLRLMNNSNFLDPVRYYTKGNAPRTWKEYLVYPRVLLTLILCIVSLVLHVAFGIYVWLIR
jgi:hypothetical protein